MKSLYLYITLVALVMLTSFAMNQFIFTDDVFYYALTDRFSAERIDEILNQRKESSWIGYAFTPFLYALKIFLVSVCLFTGSFFSEGKFSFGSFFKIAIKAEFVFLMPVFLRLFWFTFVQTDYTLQDVAAFPPVSLRNVFGEDIEDAWITYPLSIVNLFEVLYIVTLSWQMHTDLGYNFGNSFILILKSYGIGLLFWCLVVVFLLLSLT